MRQIVQQILILIQQQANSEPDSTVEAAWPIVVASVQFHRPRSSLIQDAAHDTPCTLLFPPHITASSQELYQNK